MPQASLIALLEAYRSQVDWLIAQAEEFETGARKLTGHVRGQEVDLTDNIAAEYRHRAGNLKAVIAAYERLHARETAKQSDQGSRAADGQIAWPLPGL